MHRKLPPNPVTFSLNPSFIITLLQTLRSVPCLDYLTESEVEVLATAMGVVRFAHGENIYKAGEHADRMYVVRKVGATNCEDSDRSVVVCDDRFRAEEVLHLVPKLAASLFELTLLSV
jgi:signal-transduction protein with cAMP-binding, CBS, and nucleotidyltransferase domain